MVLHVRYYNLRYFIIIYIMLGRILMELLGR